MEQTRVSPEIASSTFGSINTANMVLCWLTSLDEADQTYISMVFALAWLTTVRSLPRLAHQGGSGSGVAE